MFALALLAAFAAAGVPETCMIGRRRTIDGETMARADEALCTNIHNYVRDNHLDEMVSALVTGPTTESEEHVISSVATWCSSNAASLYTDDSRRRVESQWDAYEAMLGLALGALDEDLQHGSEEYLEKVKQIAKESREMVLRRRLTQQTGEDVELPAEMWQQCAGYAYAIQKMVTTIDGTGAFAAAIFAMNTSGGPSENLSACGAVVNSVNNALENGVLGTIDEETKLLSGMTSLEDGSVVVAASSPDALHFAELGLKAMTFTIGGVVQAGYMLMRICKSYESQIAIV